MVKKTLAHLEAINPSLLKYLEDLRTRYKNGLISHSQLLDEGRGFCNALELSGLIKSRERMAIICYITTV